MANSSTRVENPSQQPLSRVINKMTIKSSDYEDWLRRMEPRIGSVPQLRKSSLFVLFSLSALYLAYISPISRLYNRASSTGEVPAQTCPSYEVTTECQWESLQVPESIQKDLTDQIFVLKQELDMGRQKLAAALQDASLPPEEIEVKHSSIVMYWSSALITSVAFMCAALLAFVWQSKEKLVAQLELAIAAARQAKQVAQTMAFDKETAEQSVLLLEQELQRLLKQLGDARTTGHGGFSPATLIAASNKQLSKQGTPSPRIPALHGHGNEGSTTPPDSPMPSLRDEDSMSAMAPPPTVAVERYLRERNAIAIEETQLKEWLTLEGDVPKLKGLVDAAEDQLEATQTELREKEEQVKLLTHKVAEVEERLASTEMEGARREAELRRHNLALVDQVQTLSKALENLQSKLNKASSAQKHPMSHGLLSSGPISPALDGERVAS